jgi:hypothetical protein
LRPLPWERHPWLLSSWVLLGEVVEKTLAVQGEQQGA